MSNKKGVIFKNRTFFNVFTVIQIPSLFLFL